MSSSYDFEIKKGATFFTSITLTDNNDSPIDLTDYTVSGLLKYRFSDSTSLVSLNPAKALPYASGIINISIPANETATLPVTLARYDIELHHSEGYVDKVLDGVVTINPEVTY
jgi:hypothetical protein